ncbi:hypothetical protein [Novacetimonas pomaceti]|uniref:Uncharacterized protein n=1 Tax=Novacetimonas pomaceti TaxID=2021998 RepID=A0ABX5P3W1_9PROT|nr:hypothetical protein [Novacetimonas pomaceti]PYD48459.1 hypothetical protein C3920_04525 [Novacetimonas pomaceti]
MTGHRPSAPHRPLAPMGMRRRTACMGVVMGMLTAAIPFARAAPTQSVWCSASDPASQRLFISHPYQLPMTSRMALYAYGGRFARTVNLRFGMHLVLEGAYCHGFSTPHRAATAHADLIGRLAARDFQIVSVGIF